VEFLVRNLLTPEVLTLKRKARVMVTANLVDEGNVLRAVNGSLGDVTGWTAGSVQVKLDGGQQHLCIEPYTWHIDPARPDYGGVSQFPLRLAWVATIHKSQGLSLDSALIDVRATREPGQTYVALSRVRSLQGLWLRDIFAGVWVSPEAMRFMNSLRNDEPSSRLPVTGASPFLRASGF
jgi:ATP-dependent exoDNAse (exonuclease V) alpha subunit